MIRVRLGLDHWGEENEPLAAPLAGWQLTKNNKLYTATGFERTLQAMLCIDSI